MAEEETQLESPTPSDGAEPKEGEDKPAEQPSVAELQRQLEHERQLRTTEAEGKKYWFDIANKKHTPKEPEKKDDEEEDDFGDVDLAKISVDNDIKGLDKTLKKLGYVKAKDVDGKITSKTNELSTLARYTEQYPELKDGESEMFQAVVKHADALAEDPAFARLPQAKRAELAIQRAELDMLKAGKIQTNGKDTAKEMETERQAKIKAQQPGGGRKGVQSEAPPLPDNAKAICDRMGITLEEYKKHMPTVKLFR